MDIQDVIILQDLVKPGYLMVDETHGGKDPTNFLGAPMAGSRISNSWTVVPGSNSRISSPFRLNCALKASVLPIANVVLIFTRMGLFFARLFI